MADRDEKRSTLINRSRLYKTKAKGRNLNFFRHLSTPTFNSVSPEEINELNIIDHIWVVGDRYFKLADKYYGDPEKWWIIAWFNKKPTDAHVKAGDRIHIPLPLEKILYYYYS
jgi:hypothetical protein